MKKLLSTLLVLMPILLLLSCDALSFSDVGDTDNDKTESETKAPGQDGAEGDGEKPPDSMGNDTEQSDDNREDENVAEEFTPYAEVLSVKGGADGIVVLIHDDGKMPTGEILDDILVKYGLVADVAMPLSSVYNSATKTPKETNYNAWKSLTENGRWKVISHSATHTWWGTATESANGGYTFSDNEEKMYDEIVGSQTILRELFPNQRVLTFAYPGFTAEKNLYAYVDGKLSQERVLEIIYSEKSRNLLDETYISARKGYSNLPLVECENVWNYLDGYSLGNSNGKNGMAIKYLQRAANEGGIAIMYAHNLAVVDESELETYDYPSNTMAAYYMEQLCAEISSLQSEGNIWCTHYEDAIMYVREAQTATLSITKGAEECFELTLTDDMNDDIYNYPLTVRITLPDDWSAAKIAREGSLTYAIAKTVNGKNVIDAEILPTGEVVTIGRANVEDVLSYVTNVPR